MAAFAHGYGPGPWILFFPLLWVLVVGAAITLLRRRGIAPWRGGPPTRPRGEDSPIGILGHRFATGEIDEDEYWRRLSVLDAQFGTRDAKGSRR
jgi:putative membrane protein